MASTQFRSQKFMNVDDIKSLLSGTALLPDDISTKLLSFNVKLIWGKIQ